MTKINYKEHKSCYDCSHIGLCRLRYSIYQAQIKHIEMVNTENGEDPNCVMVFAHIAECCKYFEKNKDD